MTSKRYKTVSKHKTQIKTQSKTKSNRTRKLNGGGWWPNFSAPILVTGSQNTYEAMIEKYKNQIADLKAAEDVLQKKIEKLVVAKQSDTSIENERKKIDDLKTQKNKALADASSDSWFSQISNYFKRA